MKRNTSIRAKKIAKQLRRNLTPAEKYLWSKMRAGQLSNCHIRKQHPIGPFIVDFFISDWNLIIELDGESHHYQIDRDKERESYFYHQGYKVVRFQNQDVFDNVEGVVEQIRQFEMNQTNPPLTPPELRGENSDIEIRSKGMDE
ncbi:MAG: DUF559 domain-containing protein [Candidatus Hinthialibacter antarcticus]|nr:DUF559 domain-containing protein [Candidatus Hinthialibacter antarcticus]